MYIDNFKFQNSKGLSLAGRIYEGDTKVDTGVIFSHGLFSSKDGYKIIRLAESVVNTGCKLMTFDFTFSGESSGNISDISVMQEVDDLKSAILEFRKRGIYDIHLMGSSMGAVVSMIVGSIEMYMCKSLILMAAPVDLLGIIPRMNGYDIAELDDDGVTEVSGIPIKNNFFKELSSINMIEIIKKIRCPVLIFHGFADEVVHFSNVETLVNNLTVEYDLAVIDDGDHHLSRDQDIEVMKLKIQKWLTR